MKFFDLSKQEYDILFLPNNATLSWFQLKVQLNLNSLDKLATKEEVANNILKFCDYYEKQNQNEATTL